MTPPTAVGRLLVDPGTAILDQAWAAAEEIHVQDGRLSTACPREVPTLDARGLVVMHAFVDIHMHGVGPWRFWDHDSVDEQLVHIHGAARRLPRHGVGAFAPTSVTEPVGRQTLLRAVGRCLGECGDQPREGAQVLGAHAEGPFLSKEFIGAHSVEAVLPITEATVSDLFAQAAGALRIVTASPSAPRFDVLAEIALEHGATVQLGHDLPSHKEFSRAVSAGARGVTHLFNAMGGLNHRRDDFAAMALACDELYLELIINPGFVARSWIVHALKACPARVIGVSDCVGSLCDRRRFNGTPVDPARGGVWARSADGATWANTAPLDKHLPMLIQAGFGWRAISQVLALNAIKWLDLDMGIAPGDRANLVCITKHGHVVATILDGRLAWLTDETRFAK